MFPLAEHKSFFSRFQEIYTPIEWQFPLVTVQEWIFSFIKNTYSAKQQECIFLLLLSRFTYFLSANLHYHCLNSVGRTPALEKSEYTKASQNNTFYFVLNKFHLWDNFMNKN